MTTFSQLVDDMVRESRRPDLLADICDYLNQTIREVHFTADQNNAVLYAENLREDQLTANSDTGFLWNIPNPALFQRMLAVRYDSLHSREGYVYVKELSPGRGMNFAEQFFYRAGASFFFSGYGGLNSLISLAYYEYPRRLKYYAVADRPAVWDTELMDFVYVSAADVSDDTRLAARNLTSNWLLVRWRDVLVEGLKAKVYKRVSDDSRSRTSYSLYANLRNGLITSESVTGGTI